MEKNVNKEELKREVREAVDRALNRLRKRYSFLEDYQTYRQVSDGVYESIVKALEKELAEKSLSSLVLEEVVNKSMEKIFTKWGEFVLDLAGTVGEKDGEVLRELRIAARTTANNLDSVRAKENDLKREIARLKDSITTINWLNDRARWG